MKCKACNGTGIDDDRLICYECDGTGEYEPFDADIELDKLYPTELTNEEWLRSATTEELEEEILAWWVDGSDTYSHFGLFKHEIDGAKEKIVKWLKQPHSE